ncbi:MAG: hypothetical protein FWE30_03635 [Bacteroidales bacterium]|nr:hypothetical protein [Bacteroidales bacterium]
MKKLLLSILYCLAGLGLHAQSAQYKELLLNGKNKELIQLILSEIPEEQIAGDTARSLAQAYEGLLKYREAHTYYGRWLLADSNSIDALNATARMALQLGRIEEGKGLYGKAYSIDSTHFNTGLQLAKLHVQLKDYSKAYDYYYTLLLQDTTNISLLTSVGDCLYQMGERWDARYFYEEAVSLNKENASLSIILINTLLELRENDPKFFMERAMTVCDTALQYNPRNSGLIQGKAMIHYLGKNYHACDSIMRGLIAAGDSSIVNYRYICLAKFEQGIFFEALPYMEHYYQNDTTNIEAVMLLAISLGRTYDRKRALLLFDRAEELMYPTKEQISDLALQRGIVHQANRNIAMAASHYWQAAQATGIHRRDILARLVSLYPINRRQWDNADPAHYSPRLFANVTYLRTINKMPTYREVLSNIEYSQAILSLYLEDMFFKDVDRLQMESPDGKREWVTYKELQELSSGR